MKKKFQESELNKALLDISRGFSILDAGGCDFYFKHFSIKDSIIFDSFYEDALKKARKSGIKTEKELIDFAIKQGSWTKKKEEEKESLIWTKDKLEIAKNKASDQTQKRIIQNSIDEKNRNLSSLLEDREKITKISAENFAENKKVSRMISYCCFVDKDFTIPVDENDYKYFWSFITEAQRLNNKEFILNVAYKTAFFEIFSLHKKEPSKVFNVYGLDLTIFQKNILVYGNYLLNKITNCDIPESIIENPLEIFNFDPKKDSGKNKTEGIEDLKQKMTARGGKLNPEDYLS